MCIRDRNKYVGDFIKTEVDNYLHKNPLVAEVMLQKIQDSEKERKAIAGVTKLARERAKKANLHNRKLRDCRYHLSDGKGKDQETESCIFITEGDSASGSITKSRDVNTQAVFSLRGKPLNSYGLTKKVVYENEEFNLLQAALNIEDGIETLRYNKVIVATDADVDGYQIRTLVLTMLYRLTPTLIEKGYVYIAESPLYEITTKDRTYFAYTEPEKTAFLEEIGEKKYTIQRSKGLGENDPEMMWLTTMNPESRRLIKVQPADVEETARVFDLLLGDNLAGRKEHIAEHGAEYLDDLDVS